jgi:hypothetical protein
MMVPLSQSASTDTGSVATTLPANTAAYLSSEVGRNVLTGLVRVGGVTKPGLNANSLRRICGLSILVHMRNE